MANTIFFSPVNKLRNYKVKSTKIRVVSSHKLLADGFILTYMTADRAERSLALRRINAIVFSRNHIVCIHTLYIARDRVR